MSGQASQKPSLAYQRTLEGYIEYYENLRPRSVRLIEKLADPSIQFIDPFNNVRGIDAVERIMTKMFEDLKNPRFKVHDYAWGQDGITAYLRWTCRFGTEAENVIEGMSEITFAQNGLVVSHVDYWDSGAQFYAKLPFIGALIRWVMRKVAAD